MTIRVTDSGTPGLDGEAVITIDINDVNERPSLDDQVFEVAENSPAGTSVGLVAAADIDDGDVLTFRIIGGNDADAFAIDESTGEITVAGLLDHEQTEQHVLRIEVTDSGSPALPDTCLVTIDIIDRNEPPVIEPQSFDVDENSQEDTSVGTVAAFDRDADDTLTFAITAGNTGGAFAIDTGTGEIRVVQALDHEAIDQYALTVVVTDSGTPGLQDDAPVIIRVNDVNELPLLEPQAFGIDENSPIDTPVGTVIATDVDDGDTLTYSFVEGNTESAFTIDPAAGTITVAGPIDHETIDQYTLIVRVEDDGSPVLARDAEIIIDVADLNEAPDIHPQTFSIPENSATGAEVGIVIARDVDDSDVLTFNIVEGNLDDVFAIDSESGRITVNGDIDHETAVTYTLRIAVTDSGSPAFSDEALITIDIDDVNEFPSIIDQGFTVPENSAPGTTVDIVQAADVDAGDSLRFTITAGNTGDVFEIDADTGLITVSGDLDHETTEQYSLTIQVADSGAPPLTDDATIAIEVLDINEAPVVDDQSFSINENNPPSTIIGQVAAADVDDGDELAYVIVGGNDDGSFSIDSMTGELAATTAFDYEQWNHFQLTVEVHDNGEPRLDDQAEIVIDVIDLNEAPVTEQQLFSVSENSALGTSLGFVEASDQDADAVVRFRIEGGNIAKSFAIDEFTGELFVNGHLDHETIDLMVLSVRIFDNGDPPLTDHAFIIISVENVNEAPVLALPNPDAVLTFTAGNDPVAIAAGAIVTDVDSPDFDGGQLLVMLGGAATADDHVLFGAPGVGEISRAGDAFVYDGQTFGTLSGTSTDHGIVVDLNANAHTGNVELLMHAVAFHNVAANPGESERTIQIQLDDGDGDLSNTVVRRVDVTNLTFDIDGDGQYGALTDGLLVLRFLSGVDGDELIANAVGVNCSQCSHTAIVGYLVKLQDRKIMDIDGDDVTELTTDGLLLIRYLFGIRGDWLTANAISETASRRLSEDIAMYLQQFAH